MLTITLNNLLYMINHICLVFLQNTIIFTKLVQPYIQCISRKLAKATQRCNTLIVIANFNIPILCIDWNNKTSNPISMDYP